jgi:hypothetical protein
MWLFALKLTITPCVIAAATLAARRFGPAVGGWLVGLPLTLAPVAVFLAFERSPSFVAHVSSGAVAGITAEAAFAVSYAAVAVRGGGWAPSLVAGTAGFIAAGLAVERAHPPLGVLVTAAVASLIVALRFLPRAGRTVWPRTRFELPLRMALATSLVLLVTTFASTLGPGMSGLATTYPLITTTLAIFAHRSVGAAGAIAVYRGLMIGVFAMMAFAATLDIALTRLPLAAAFVLAFALTAAVQLGSFPAVRRGSLA